MKKITLLSAIILQTLFATAQKFEWVSHSSQGYTNVNNAPLAVDAAGNSYTVIFTWSSVPVIIQSDTFQVLGPNTQGMCVAKFDANGTYLWGKMFCSANSTPRSIGVDASGAVYVTAQLDGGITYSTDTTYSNPFIFQVIKLSTNGDFIKTIFINQPSVVPLLAVQGTDVYSCYYGTVEKRDSALNVIWSFTAPNGSVNFNGNLAATLFVKGATLIVSAWEGNYGTVIPFSNDSIYFTTPGGFNEAKIIKMDTSGQLHQQHPFPYGTQLRGITEDSQGNIYVGASGLNTLIYFANDTLFNTINPGAPYAAVFKWDAAGNPLNAVPIYNGNAIYDMDMNAQDEILFTLDANSGPAVIYNITLPLNGILIKLDTAGNVVWYKTAIGNFSIKMVDVVMRNGNEYMVSGSFNNALTCGCIVVAATTVVGNFVTMISEQPEPVPTAAFSVLQTGSTVLFKDTTQNATSLLWNFGDAATSNLKEPIHTYAQPGVYNVCLSATNICGSGQHCETITVKGIRAIVTNRGSNAGVVTADIFGGGFTSITTVLLKQAASPDIVPYTTTFINSGKLEVRLDLTSQPVGLWDVEVTVPGDTVMTLVNGFTIDTSSTYLFDITNSGPVVNRPNRWMASQITIHNKSNQDAVGVTVTYRLDDTWNTFVNTTFFSPQQIPFLNSGYQYLVANGLNTSLTNHTFSDTTFDSNYGAFIIPVLRANSSYKLPLYIRGTISVVSPKLATARGTLLESSSIAGNYAPSPDACFSDYFKHSIESALSISISPAQWNSCFPALFDSLRMVTSVQANDVSSDGTPVSLPAAIVSMLSAMASSGCITGIPAVLTETEIKSVILKTLKNIIDSTELHELIPVCPLFSQFRQDSQQSTSLVITTNTTGHNTENAIISCLGAAVTTGFAIAVFAPPLAIGGALSMLVLCTIITASCDPNQISGPGNNADDIFQKPGDISSYTIAFENDSAATAPAQVVIITDTLDVSRFDMNTFRFTHVAIGDSLKFEFDEPGFSQLKVSSFAPSNSDYLRTEATIDTATGIIQWLLTTVDNVNYQPDTNALAGFLPPNINGTEGTGYLSYEVKLKSTLVTNDSIKNRATIVFDTNAPIVTNEWLNVIDITKPQSAVNTLPPTTPTDSFVVSWAGTDFIAGIMSYNIYVSVNDLPYQLWLGATDTTQAMFHGANGNQYEFFSKAMDLAGNVEDAPANPDNNPDAVTTVVVGIDELEGVRYILLFPNPSSQSVNLSYELIDNSSVEISMFDILGSEVSMLANEKQIAGKHQKQIDLSRFSEGIYLLKINVNGNELVKKLIKM